MPEYHLHRKEKEITSEEEIEEILRDGKYATIALCRGNEPYIVTLSYGYDKGKGALYFHCAKKGLKIDFLRENPKVCATVIEDKGYKKDECEQAYRSVVFWGEMAVVEDLPEKIHGMDVLLQHLEENPDPIRERNLKEEKAYKGVGILRLDIQSLTGKRGD
ncbi:MAG: pyridoxamine 5'-phosphate oxidase family protein [Planctomycetota bacterium]|jgi:nitroimidazol reductase NimA-like FMN-containing flavoprotein (pyridoxamine 5'-phosphate oxidase superfamily)